MNEGMMDNRLKISGVSGPFREPKEAVFSYDYAVLRASWPMPHAIRVKVAIAEELEVLKSKIIGTFSGSPGQQLLVTQMLSRKIADEKLRIMDEEGNLSDRRDVMIPPFVGEFGHFFNRLERWATEQQSALRTEIGQRVKL
jgi:hypothetical protein